jgi:hypothetical protein
VSAPDAVERAGGILRQANGIAARIPSAPRGQEAPASVSRADGT